MAFGRKEKEEKKSKVESEAPKTDLEKFDVLFKLSAQLDKEFGGINTLIKPTEPKKIIRVPSIATGMPSFDEYVSQSGGIPRGAIVEIYGPESAGKTTFTLHVIAEEQKQGGIAAFIDAEHALNLVWASKIGVDTNKLFINQPDSGEQALEVAKRLIESKAVSLIVIDSAAALTPEAELAGEMTDQHVGVQARMMAKGLRKITGIAHKNGVTVIFINQIREKIGVMYGNPETTPTGRALKHYASMRIDVRRRDAITLSGNKEDSNVIGHQIKLKAVKNKVGVPLREAVVSLMYEDGFDKTADLVSYAVEVGAVEQSGAWMKFGEDKYHGLGQLSDAIKADPKKEQALKKAIKESVGVAI